LITLQRPDAKVSIMLGKNKQLTEGDMIRPSIYAIPFALKKRSVIYNSLTQQCIESKYYDWFKNCELKKYDPKDSEMRLLVETDYLVPDKCDEATRYDRLINMIRLIEKQKSGYTSYTILPTTACNARCTYCYEAGISYDSMSDEVIDNTIRYIKATSMKDEMINIHWFGGEPLMGEDIIDKICAGISNCGIEFTSRVTSNGSLLTAEIIDKMKKNWKVERVQITLDGREEEYCKRKRYVSFNGSPYRAVFEGIRLLLQSDIRVDLRLNVDEKNVEELHLLIDELDSEFNEKDNIGLYAHEIYGADEDDQTDVDAFYAGLAKLNQRICDFLADDKEAKADETAFYDKKGRTSRYFCGADAPMASPVIAPDGSLYLCENIVDVDMNSTVGDCTIIDKDRFISRKRIDSPKCRTCSMLPICTDFSSCPEKMKDCFKYRESKLRRSIMGLDSQTKLPPVKICWKGTVVRIVEPTEAFVIEHQDLLVPDYQKAEKTMEMSGLA